MMGAFPSARFLRLAENDAQHAWLAAERLQDAPIVLLQGDAFVLEQAGQSSGSPSSSFGQPRALLLAYCSVVLEKPQFV
jgi:hypothetical protein